MAHVYQDWLRINLVIRCVLREACLMAKTTADVNSPFDHRHTSC